MNITESLEDDDENVEPYHEHVEVDTAKDCGILRTIRAENEENLLYPSRCH